ncbi:MAG TPA: alcohol dehydrogenase catalytic domain-containing protein [Streptosporangiales bacterium]
MQVVLGTDALVHVEPSPDAAVGAPGEVLLAPVHMGICGSDVHVLHGRHPFARPPVVTGHEIVARVLDVGADVRRVAPGDAAVVNPLVWCGTCPRCRAGAVNQCAEAKVRGFRVPGLARARVAVDERYCHRVPDGVPTRVAVLTEPLAVAWHATARGGDLGRVLVIGAGPVGLAVLRALRWRGAGDVTVVEPVAGKRETAIGLGADRAVAPGALPAGLEVDTTFDCVAADTTLHTAGAVTVPGGTIVVVGVPDDDRSLPLPRLQRWEIDVRGTGLYVSADIEAALSRLGDDTDAAARLVTAEHPVTEAAAAFAAAEQPDHIKVLITWPT